MYILAIETTGAFASVALAKAGDSVQDFEVLAHVEGSDRYSHLQNLTPQIEQVLREAGESALSINDVSAIAVSHGPGSFTGIRIGVSTTRALSQVLGIPCVAVSSLEALAMRAATPADTLVCPILDARRSQVYGGGYTLDEDGFPVEVIEAGPYTVDEFLQALDEAKAGQPDQSTAAGNRILFTGDGVDKYGDMVNAFFSQEGKEPEKVAFAEEAIRYQDAITVAKLGWKLLQEGKDCAYENLKPEYMRQAEAERKLKAGELNKKK